MKIDLHCHTKNVKSGDGDKREPSVDLFKEKVEMSQVRIIAITNHNYFDIDQYKLFREEVSGFCDVWPGIELDVKEIGDHSGHVIVIANPDKVVQFDSIVRDKINNSSADSFCITVTELCSLFNPLEVIYIPHYIKKPFLDDRDYNLLFEKAYSTKRVLCEPSGISSIGVLNANGYRGVLGTDVRNWDSYEECTFADLKYEFKGYNNFLKLLDKDIVFVKDLINKNAHETITVYGNHVDKGYPFTINIYNDINIIFGDKGSGKSEIIDSLAEYYKNVKGVEPVVYKGGDKTGWFTELIRPTPKEFSFENFRVRSCDDCIKMINSFSDKLPVKLEDYRLYIENISENKKRKKLKILSQSLTFSINEEKFNKSYDDYSKIIDFIREFKNSNIYKENSKKYELLINELNKLAYDSYDYCLEEWCLQKRNFLSDNAIQMINTYASESDGTPEMPKETGFYEFSKNRFSLQKNTKQILDILNSKPRIISKEYIGKIGDKGDCFVNNVIGFINLKNITDIDTKKISGKKTYAKKFIDELYKINNCYLNENLSDNVSEIKKIINENQINDINYFIYNEKKLLIKDYEYRPSKGEMTILSLQYELLNKENKKIFLIDEPEVNLGSMYIENTIVPLIKDLGKSKKIVVIATHDANIATRTYPITSIFKLMINGKYITYQGSMFTNELVNIANEQDIRKWDVEGENYLEGGQQAFIERGNLYGKIN